MKRKTLLLLLGAEFIILTALIFLTLKLPDVFSSVLAFPFEQIGEGLKALSLSGSFGNGLALSICVGISMLPLAAVFKHKSEKGYLRENAALCCLSALLLFVLVAMTNRGFLYNCFPNTSPELLKVIKAVMGCSVWSVVVLWLVLRLLRLFGSGSTNKLFGYLRVMLYVLCALFTAVIAVSCGGALLNGISGMNRGLDVAMAAVRFFAEALAYALDIYITLSALSLLDILLSENPLGVAECAEKVSRRCSISLGLTAAVSAVVNILQLLLSMRLSDIAVSADIPVMSIAFVLAVFLASRLIAENRRLKDDNDLFI